MADSIKTSSQITVGIEYYNEDGNRKTANINIPNPKSNLTETQIRTAIGQALAQNALIIEDSISDTISPEQIYTAYTTDESINDLDIGVVN